MTTAQLIALVTALAGLLSAIGAIIALVRHQTGPAHKQPIPPAK